MKKGYFQNFSSFVYKLICMIMRMTTMLNKFSDTRVSGMKLHLFDPEMISAHFLWGNVFLKGEL